MNYLPVEQMGKGDLGWLQSNFHFSFAGYYNASNIHFNALRVINHDIIAPGTGFDTHPHRDMEIITYVIKGELTHTDSMGNRRTVGRGGVQYMSAGTGITHSEYNHGAVPLELLQIWIMPWAQGLEPNYGDATFRWEERESKALQLAGGRAPIAIAQDANLYALSLEPGKHYPLTINQGRACYLIQIEGQSSINHQMIESGDAITLQQESITIKAISQSHYCWVELAMLQ